MRWNLYGEKDGKWQATQLPALYSMIRVMAMSTTRERSKKLIGSETDVGTVAIADGMRMIDISAGDCMYSMCDI